MGIKPWSRGEALESAVEQAKGRAAGKGRDPGPGSQQDATSPGDRQRHEPARIDATIVMEN